MRSLCLKNEKTWLVFLKGYLYIHGMDKRSLANDRAFSVPLGTLRGEGDIESCEDDSWSLTLQSQ